MAGDVTQRISGIIADVLEIESSRVKPTSHFFNDLGASSLDIAEMVWRIEDDKSFGVGEIPDEVLENVRCVQDVVDFIEGRQHGAPVDAMDSPSEPEAIAEVPPAEATPTLERWDVVVGSDHAGFGLKEVICAFLQQRGLRVRNMGPDSTEHVDYPVYAERVGRLVASGAAERGILVCGTGIGMSIAANKVVGVRAAHVQDPLSARLARQHNDANVLCLGARIVGETMAAACVEAFVKTAFTPGDDARHRRRLDQVSALEGALPGAPVVS